jgi:hypothetical protein
MASLGHTCGHWLALGQVGPKEKETLSFASALASFLREGSVIAPLLDGPASGI